MNNGNGMEPAGGYAALKVLVVDDTQHMTSMIGELLRGFGFQNILQSTTGTDGYKIFRKSCIDLILCAYLLDEMNGIEFTRKVRTDPESPDKTVPIIMMTSHADRATIIEARDAGVNEFIRKPFTASDLRKKVHVTIIRPRPFVAAPSFSGPDRRRRKLDKLKGADRRATKATIIAPRAPD